MNQLPLDLVKQYESYSTLNSPCSATSRWSHLFRNFVPSTKRRKSRSQLKPFILQSKTIKGPFRRKSCCCDECGQLGIFQYKCMNIKGPKPFRKHLLTRRGSNQLVQSAQPKAVQRVKQALKKMKTYDESKINQICESKNPITLGVIQESVSKLHTYFHKQQQQQLKVHSLAQFTPSCSPKHLKTTRSLPYLTSYMTYRKIDSTLLKPLKPINQQSQIRSQLITIHKSKHHQKTLSTVAIY